MLKTIRPYLLLTLLSCVLYLPGIFYLPVIDRDEAHFAQATRQMLQTHNFFQIRFQEKTRFQKPPGINWLQAAAVKVVGDENNDTIWPYRLPSFLGALLSILMMYYFSRRFFSEKTALTAAALLSCSFLLVVEAHMAVIDTSLLSSIVLMQGTLWIIYSSQIRKQKAHWGWAFVFWLAMSYGFVLKGVTPLVGVLTCTALCGIERRVDWLKGLRPLWGIVLFILLSLAWLFAVNAAENSNYLLQMVNRDLLPKLKGGHESHGQLPLFHLAILPITFWASSLFLWQGGCFAYKNKHLVAVKFLLAWIIPTWVFFELMPTKLPQYILPTFPAIALLCALSISKENSSKAPGKWLHFLQLLWAAMTLVLAGSLIMLSYMVLGEVSAMAVALSTAMSLLAMMALRFAWVGAYYRAVCITVVLSMVAFPLIFSSILPRLEPIWVSQKIASKIDGSKISQKRPLLVVGYSEPSLVFYLNTRKVFFTTQTVAVKALEQEKGRIAVFDLKTYEKLPGHSKYKIIEKLQGYNYSKGKNVHLLIVES